MSYDPIQPEDLFDRNPIEIKHEAFFVGRGREMGNAMSSALTPGQSINIHGSFGVGKTSFARALYRMLSGEVDLAQRLKILLPINPGRRLCLWYDCGETDTFESAVNRIYELNINEIEETYRDDVFDGRPASAYTEGQVGTDRLYAVSKRLAARKPNERITVFMDEFHALLSHDNLPTVLKTARNFSFVFCGRENVVQEKVIKRYPSVSREFDSFELKLLPYENVIAIFDNAETASKNRLTFLPEFRERIYRVSDGHPFMVQRYGFSAVQSLRGTDKVEHHPVDVELAKHYEETLLNRSNEAPIMRDALEGNVTRKAMLKALAARPNQFVSGEALSNETGIPTYAPALDGLTGPENILREKNGAYAFVNPFYRAVAFLMLEEF